MNKQTHNLQSHIQFDTVSPATKLLQKRRRMYQVHQAFQAQKEQYKKDQQKFKKIQQQIRKRDLQIQIQLVDFCQFLQQNQIKKKKAQQRFKQQEKAFNDKLNQIKSVQDVIQDLMSLQKLFQSKVQSLRKYEQYLQRVRTAYNDQFPQIADILSRYATLKRANNNYINERNQMQQTYEKLKIQGINYQKQMNQSILQLNNEIKQLSRKLEQLINKKNEFQIDVQKKHEVQSRKTLMAIDNLYFKCGEGSQKIKHRQQDYLQVNNNKKNNKKKQGKKVQKQAQQKKKQDEQNNYQSRSQTAIRKLQCIFNYMKDFKTVIQSYQKIKINNSIKK